jgi:hypothetical protein
MLIGVGHATLCPTYAGATIIGALAIPATADFKLLMAGSINPPVLPGDTYYFTKKRMYSICNNYLR